MELQSATSITQNQIILFSLTLSIQYSFQKLIYALTASSVKDLKNITSSPERSLSLVLSIFHNIHSLFSLSPSRKSNLGNKPYKSRKHNASQVTRVISIQLRFLNNYSKHIKKIGTCSVEVSHEMYSMVISLVNCQIKNSLKSTLNRAV